MRETTPAWLGSIDWGDVLRARKKGSGFQKAVFNAVGDHHLADGEARGPKSRCIKILLYLVNIKYLHFLPRYLLSQKHYQLALFVHRG